MNGCQCADPVEIIGTGGFQLWIDGRHQPDEVIACDDIVHKADGAGLANGQGNGGLRENDDTPQWNSYATLAANALLNGNPRYQVLSGFDQFDPSKFTFTSTFTF